MSSSEPSDARPKDWIAEPVALKEFGFLTENTGTMGAGLESAPVPEDDGRVV